MVLVPVAVLRWQALRALVQDSRRFAAVAAAYVGLVAWVYFSAAWAPEGASPNFSIRHLCAPMLVAHAGVALRGLLFAAIVGGGFRAAVAAVQIVGIAVPEALAISHVSKATLAMQLLGVSAFTLAASARSWTQWPAPVGTFALWVAGTLQLASRGSAIAGIVGGIIGVVSQSRSWRRLAVVAVSLALAVGAAAMVLRGSPLEQKVAMKGALAEKAGGEGQQSGGLSLERLDTILSSRLVLWHWTLHRLPRAAIAGRGLGSWAADFNAAAAAGLVTPSWRSTPWPPDLRMPHAHNLYLQVAYEQGVVGLALLASLVVALLRCVWRHPDHAVALFGVTLLSTLLLARCNMGADIDSRVSGTSFAFLVCTAALACRPAGGSGRDSGERFADAPASPRE